MQEMCFLIYSLWLKLPTKSTVGRGNSSTLLQLRWPHKSTPWSRDVEVSQSVILWDKHDLYVIPTNLIILDASLRPDCHKWIIIHTWKVNSNFPTNMILLWTQNNPIQYKTSWIVLWHASLKSLCPCQCQGFVLAAATERWPHQCKWREEASKWDSIEH